MRTCLSDALAPSVWRSARRVLRRAGVEVEVPRGQTCCGQPAWTAGHPDQARAVARRALAAFAGDAPVVVPSGSCAAMVTHAYPELFAGTPEEQDARRLAARTLELTQLIERHGLAVASAARGRVAYHDSCHMLRLLGERESARAAIRRTGTLELVEIEESSSCCGFGGVFSVAFPEVSGALGEEKARRAAETGADALVACDLSCLLHIAGRARRLGIPLRPRHVAEVLAE